MIKLILLASLLTLKTCKSLHSDFRLYGYNANFETRVDVNCTYQGIHCKNCYTLVQCVEDENGYLEILLENCKSTAGSYCWNNTACNTNYNPTCNSLYYTFNCPGNGIFPDPFDCKKYHYCVKLEGTTKPVKTTLTCQGDYAYNMVTTYCDIKLKTCPFNNPPCPQCKTIGQTGPLINKSIYYLCTLVNKDIVPELHLCPNGKWYNGSTCVEH